MTFGPHQEDQHRDRGGRRNVGPRRCRSHRQRPGARPADCGPNETPRLPQYEIDTAEEQCAWQRIVRDLEDQVLPFLLAGKPGMLFTELAGELWCRTQGYLGDGENSSVRQRFSPTEDRHRIQRKHSTWSTSACEPSWWRRPPSLRHTDAERRRCDRRCGERRIQGRDAVTGPRQSLSLVRRSPPTVAGFRRPTASHAPAGQTVRIGPARNREARVCSGRPRRARTSEFDELTVTAARNALLDKPDFWRLKSTVWKCRTCVDDGIELALSGFAIQFLCLRWGTFLTRSEESDATPIPASEDLIALQQELLYALPCRNHRASPPGSHGCDN